MSLLARNDEVFLLSGPELVGGPGVSLREQRSAGCSPVMMEVLYTPARKSTATVEVTWNELSEARRRRGETTDFALTVARAGATAAGDLLVLRWPLRADQAWDPVFATVGAITFRTTDPGGAIGGAELGFGSELGLAYACPIGGGPVAHLATAWRYLERPAHPYMELRLHLRPGEAPVSIHVGRLFVGQTYDPYVYNPGYEYAAFVAGRPDIPGADEVKAEFERAAVEASRSHLFMGMQAFIRPFVVLRQGTPAIPMLVGTPNSISWYALEPEHHVEEYAAKGYIEPGDVTLDCGAHAGQMSALFGLVAGSSGKTFAFDPFPQNYLQVEAQGRLNGLHDFVSTRTGVAETRRTIEVSINGQSIAAQNRATDAMDISLEPLDDYVDARPTFLKLDVEGAEVSALHGAQKLLRECRPKIFVELHTQFLPSFGFTLTDFFEAIPRDIYDVDVAVEGVDATMRRYEPGLEKGVKAPMIVWARAR